MVSMTDNVPLQVTHTWLLGVLNNLFRHVCRGPPGVMTFERSIPGRAILKSSKYYPGLAFSGIAIEIGVFKCPVLRWSQGDEQAETTKINITMAKVHGKNRTGDAKDKMRHGHN